MHGSGASSRNLRTDPDHDVWVDRVDDVGGIADSHEAAQLWLQSLSAANAGSEPQPIFVPESVQQGLLEYYSNALSTVEGVRRKDDSAEHAEQQKRSATATAPGGSCDFACEGEDSEAVGVGANDVPLHMAKQPIQLVDDHEPVRIGHVRRAGQEVLLDSLMVNQLLSCLTVSSLATVGLNSMYATRVAPVFHGGALAVMQGFFVAIVWAAKTGDTIHFLCSCGGPRRATFVETALQKGESSKCSHAASLCNAFLSVASQLGLSSLLQLVERFPVLLSTSGRSSTRPFVEHIAMMRNEREVWAVCAMGVWCALVQPVKSAASQAPRCQNVRCASRPRCIHSLAYFKFRAEHKEAGDQRDDDNAEQYDDDGVLLERRDEEGAAPTPVPVEETHEANFARRRARNMLPCPGEVRCCQIFDSYGRAGRSKPSGMESLPRVMHERYCINCGKLRGNRPLKVANATLFTMGGPISIRTGIWTCECQEVVHFDGADSALFAYSSKTVFTRVYLDIIIHIALTSRSSFTAATAAMAFCLHVTAGLPLGANGNTRQMIILASGLLTETLIIPPSSYACRLCLEEAGVRRYLTLVVDGQVLGFFRELSRPFVRHLVDNPVVEILISNGCAVKKACVRSAIRKRCATDIRRGSSLTKAELKALGNFIVASNKLDPSERKCDDSAIGQSSAEHAAWAASYIFSSFFCITTLTDGEDDLTSDGSSRNSSSDSASAASKPGAVSEIAAGSSDGEDEPGEAGTEEGRPGDSTLTVCSRIKGAVGDERDDRLVLGERWRIVQRFVGNFIAEPVIGMLVGCDQAGVEKLALALIEGKPYSEWKLLTDPVEKLSLVWPFLFQVADDLDGDHDLARSIGELVLFALDADNRMEKLWMEKSTDKQKAFAAKWETTDKLKYQEWEREQGVTAPNIRLRAHPLSHERAVAQEIERVSGSVFPSLYPVRPFTFDSMAEKLRKKKATKRRQKLRKATSSPGSSPATRIRRRRSAAAGKGRNRDRGSTEAKAVNDDDCRHDFEQSNVFTPGVMNVMCPHGMLIGFEMLEHAESPACVAEILARRLALMPRVIYFDTACQASRNATRRMPWLLRRSLVKWFLDRFHQPKHLCSDMFNPDEYPEISSLHKTSVAESRHALNKPLQNQVSYMTQDRFVSHMRLYGALNNLRIQLRFHLRPSERAPQPEVGHIPLPRFFHEQVVTYCERRGCPCGRGERFASEEDQARQDSGKDGEERASVEAEVGTGETDVPQAEAGHPSESGLAVMMVDARARGTEDDIAGNAKAAFAPSVGLAQFTDEAALDEAARGTEGGET